MNFLLRDFSFVYVHLITNNNDTQILISILFTFMHPLLTVVEWFLVRQIENQDSSSWWLIVASCDRLKWFLPSCIPYLKFNLVSLDINYFSTKFNPNCHIIIYCECVIEKSSQNCWFTDCWISNDYSLKHILEVYLTVEIIHYIKIIMIQTK